MSELLEIVVALLALIVVFVLLFFIIAAPFYALYKFIVTDNPLWFIAAIIASILCLMLIIGLGAGDES